MSDDIIEEVKRRVDELGKDVQRAAAAVNRAIQALPDALAYLGKIISDEWAKFARLMREFWDKVEDFLNNTGSPAKLERHADIWRHKIGNPLGTVAGTIALGNLKTTTEWSGNGADAYRVVVPTQGATLNSMKALALTIAGLLKELANGIENFWIAFGFAVASLTVAVVSISASLGPQAAVTVPIACAAAAAAIGFTAFAVTQLKAIHDSIDTKQDTLKQGLHDLGTAWTKATPQNAKKLSTPADWTP